VQIFPAGPDYYSRGTLCISALLLRSEMPISGSIFQGVTTSPCRDFVAKEILSANPSVVYMPCAGRFGAAEAYIKHGGDKKALYTSDISLFSSMIGYLFDPSKTISDLEIVNSSVIQSDSNDCLDVVSATMLAIKYSQIKANTLYGINSRNEIVHQQQKYKDSIKEQVSSIVEAMDGCHYDILDLMQVIKDASLDSNAALYVNVPMRSAYRNGYDNMFGKTDISWSYTPSYFSPSQLSSLCDIVQEASCNVYMYWQNSLDKVPNGFQAIYAQSITPERTDYIIANRKAGKSYAVPQNVFKPTKIYQIYSDEEITDDAIVSFVAVDEPTALYYRDLFVHKLGSTTAEAFYLMLIDGRVCTTMGLSLRDVNTRKSNYVAEVFGISRSSVRYKRLGKLFMFCLTSGDFKRQLQAKYRFDFFDIKGIKTSSITTHCEGKTDRSVMKLTFREKLKSGQYRVIYQSDFRDDTYKDCLKLWLSKWGDIKRNEVKNGTTA